MRQDMLASIPVVAVLLLKLCLSSIEWQLMYFHQDDYAMMNGSCTRVANSSADGTAPAVTSGLLLVFVVGLILPPICGLLYDSSWGLARPLRAVAALVALTAAALLAIVYGRLACNGTVFYSAWLLLLPSMSGLGEPLLLSALFYLCREASLQATVPVLGFYAAASLGEVAGLAPYLGGEAYHWAVTVPVTAAFVAISLPLSGWMLRNCRAAALADSFQLPSMERLASFWKLASFVLPFMLSILLGRQDVTPMEMAFYRNSSTYAAEQRSCFNLLACMYTAGTVTACIVASAVLSARGGGGGGGGGCGSGPGLSIRMRLGLLLELLCRLTQIGINLQLMQQVNRQSNAQLVTALYAAVSFADGLAAGITMPAVYEAVGAMADPNARTVILGVLITMWSLATVMGGLVLYPLKALPRDAPILQPRPGSSPKFYVLHLANVAWLLGSFACLQFVGLPSLRRLRAAPAAGSEAEPLVPLVAQG